MRVSFCSGAISVVVIAILGIGLTTPAFATEPEPSHQESVTTSEVVAPKATSTAVEAPVEPERPVQVLLELVINERGTVEDSAVVSGPEPFAAAALSASSRFEFQPARLRGKPISAKIRFLVRFEPKELLPPTPPQALSTTPTPTPSALQTRAATNSPPPLEVVVVGVRPAYTTGTITRAEAREVPGTFGDPLRAVESTPGVTPVFSGVPYFFVRGAPPGNVGFFLDGVKVPLLYHALLGPSVIHPALIDHVDTYRGAPSAQYGRYAGAVINAETRPGLSRLGGEANVRLFDAGGLVETPFASGKGHALVGGRYSYTALAASLVTDANLDYWDYQTRVDYALSAHSRIGVFAFGAYDSYYAPDEDRVQRGASSQFHRVDLRYDFETARTNSRVAVTLGYDRSKTNSGELRDHLIGARAFTRHQLSRQLAFDWGGDVSIDQYGLHVDRTTAEAADVAALFPARTDITGGGFAEISWNPVELLSLTPGVRVDGYRVDDKTAVSVDPRLSATFRPNRIVYTSYTIGLLHQAPNYIPQLPAAQVGTLEGGLQHAWSASSTVGTRLPFDFTAAATGYRVAFFDLLDPIGRSNDLFSLDSTVLQHRERGSSIGLELEIRRPMTRRVGGFLSCTLSRTERSDGTRESLSAYDRPLVLQGALGVDLGRNFRAGARVAYYSGVPALEHPGFGSREPYYSGSRRSPGFFRTDLRLEKRWPIPGRGYWAVVAEMLNATMSREYTARECSSSHCINTVSGPLAIPSVGLELYSY